mmetsp:Transcript_17688/g.35511  ORF Transcript_17688/g.35511 Transcript_17688/m.35511 type:complete len:89 (-) Transcript_17688:90-356(-)
MCGLVAKGFALMVKNFPSGQLPSLIHKVKGFCTSIVPYTLNASKTYAREHWRHTKYNRRLSMTLTKDGIAQEKSQVREEEIHDSGKQR